MLSLNSINFFKYYSKLRINCENHNKNQFFNQILNKSKNFSKHLLRVCHSNESSLDIEWTEESDLRQEFNSDERRIAKTFREHRLQQRLRVEQPLMPRLARVALIGTPNAGKSTLTNQLVGRKISSVSSKVHTTRHKVIGIIVSDETQIQLLDTPGVVSTKHCAKHKLESNFMSDPLTGSDGADIIAVICDVSNPRERERINVGVLRLLERHPNKESVLILNKIDKINEKRKLLDITTRLTAGVVGGITSIKHKKTPIPNNKRGLEMLFQRTEDNMNTNYSFISNKEENEEIEEKVGWNRFSQVFMTCALSGDGIEDIYQYLLSKARFQPWIYHRSQVTDQSPQELVKTTLKEKFLDLFREEIPYKLQYKITMWHLDQSGNIFVTVDVLCPQRFMSLVIGPKGQTISSIVQMVRQSLSNTFHCEVSLKLIVKGIQNK